MAKEDEEREKLVTFFSANEWGSVRADGYLNKLTPAESAIKVMTEQKSRIAEQEKSFKEALRATPTEAKLNQQVKVQERLLERARDIFIILAPSVAILSRDERHAPSTREEMSKGEELMLAFLRDLRDRK